MVPEKLKDRLQAFYHSFNRRTGGSLTIVRRAVVSFDRARGAEAAASISYYALFSFFPLLLALTSVLGILLVNVNSPSEVIQFVTQAIPISQEFISQNLLQIIEQRTSIGVIGLIGLIWAASGVFITLTRNINRAWPDSHLRNIVQTRLLAIGMVGGVSLLLLISIIATTVINLLPRLDLPFLNLDPYYQNFVVRQLSVLLPWLAILFVFFVLYYWVPNTRVHWPEALIAAVIAALAFEVGSRIFTWYLSSGLVNFELVYGSLGTIIGLMLWIYISSMIILIGAHLSAAIAFVWRISKEDPHAALEGETVKEQIETAIKE